jgi:hypothetical protein
MRQHHGSSVTATAACRPSAAAHPCAAEHHARVADKDGPVQPVNARWKEHDTPADPPACCIDSILQQCIARGQIVGTHPTGAGAPTS